MRFKNIILQFLILFSFFFISLQIWLDRFFGVVDFEQLIIFLSFGATGLLDSDDYIINKFIQICIFLPIFLTFIFNLLFKYFFLWKSNNIKKIFITLKKFKFYFSLFFLAVSILFFLKSISFEDFLLRNNKIDFIKNYYIQPNLEDFKNKKENKNLVLIYVESLDDILLNEKLLPKETFDKYSLKDFRAKSVKKFIPTKYTNWTIGSIVATQCGIPQKPIGILDIENNKLNRNKLDKFGFGMKNFLPNAICIGDLLKKANYKNIFINAVNLKFANTGLFFKEHGYEEIIGKTYFDNLNLKHERFTWGGGPNDRVLFKLAKTKIKDFWYSPPTHFDTKCIDSVRNGAKAFDYSSCDIVSGAGHDAVYISRLAPTGMIFIPCEDGISHNEIENATPEDCAAGANVLLYSILDII